MLRVARSILIVVGGLTLVLPPGWCCFIGSVATGAHTAKQAHACPCCQPTAPATPAKDAPQPLPPGGCPCDERSTTVVAEVRIDAPGHSAPVFLSPIDHGSQQIGHLAPVAILAVAHPGAAPPIHVLHCFWLC